jgi:hypothetical protein
MTAARKSPTLTLSPLQRSDCAEVEVEFKRNNTTINVNGKVTAFIYLILSSVGKSVILGSTNLFATLEQVRIDWSLISTRVSVDFHGCGLVPNGCSGNITNHFHGIHLLDFQNFNCIFHYE